MDFRDEVLNAQKEYVDPNVIKQRELEKRKKEHQILVDNYANQIVYSVKSALVSRAKKVQQGTPFIFEGFIAISFPGRGLYSSDDDPVNSYLGKEYSKHIIFDEKDSQSGQDYKTVCKLSNDAEIILQTAKKLLAKDNIMLYSYWAEMAGETFDMPIEMTAKGKRLSSEKSIYTIRLKHGLKEVEITSEVSPAIHHPYTLGVHCSYDVRWHPGEV